MTTVAYVEEVLIHLRIVVTPLQIANIAWIVRAMLVNCVG
jgi:hypothetical protein